MNIQFLGGAGTVTGSKTLVETGGKRLLIDCGLFQGLKALRELNWAPFPVGPETLDSVLLTHGHLDHCGFLPRLVAQGFNGKIYCTAPTRDIARLILLDSAKIQEEEAAQANERAYSKHAPALPLYTVAEAEYCLRHFHTVAPDTDVLLGDGMSFRFFPAGHIIGACSIALHAEGKVLVFSGDIGRDDDVLMYPPVKPLEADYVFLESTYGNRLHPATHAGLELETLINNTVRKNGTVIIPGFAIERIQSVMYEIWQLLQQQRLPDVPYIVDSPMGISVLEVFEENTKWHKLKPPQCGDMCRMFRMVSSFAETIEILYDQRPKVIIAASGMLTGGRVLKYLEQYISLPETAVILTGFQAEGTRGRKLLEGDKSIKIWGKYYPVRAQVFEISGMSAHADQGGLMNWLSALKKAPVQVFLVHGENESADTLRLKISERFGWDCHVPLLGSSMEL